MRRVVFLERDYNDDITISHRVVMWFPIPAERREWYADPGFVSALKGNLKPSANELQLLRTGAVREKVTSIGVEKFSPQLNRQRTEQELLAEIKRVTEERYLWELARLPTALITASLYGTTYDDTVQGGWTVVVEDS
jgi:hypothetical protein